MSSQKTNIQELLRLLRVRVEDETDLAFNEGQKYDAMEQAQRYLCTVVHNNYLTSLENLVTVTSDGNGKINLDALCIKTASDGTKYQGLFRNEIISIKGTVSNIDRNFKKISVKDKHKLDNDYLSASLDNPLFYIYSDAIYLLPSRTWEVEILYIKEPTQFRDVFNSYSLNTYCDLERSLIDPLLDYAESYLWKIDNKPNRVGLAQQSATATVNLLNQRFGQERKIGIGDVGGND
tara:strand:- start:8524 stop:9228 length:705 start_codon:yes stop_codon:yes gene_type:complete